ncbi:hypothetical protein MRX96_032221 [Rhipicephalus microplus]
MRRVPRVHRLQQARRAVSCIPFRRLSQRRIKNAGATEGEPFLAKIVASSAASHAQHGLRGEQSLASAVQASFSWELMFADNQLTQRQTIQQQHALAARKVVQSETACFALSGWLPHEKQDAGSHGETILGPDKARE